MPAFSKPTSETMYSPSQYYASRVDSLSSRIAVHRRRNRMFVVGEIVTFVLFIAFVAAYAMLGWGWVAVWLGVLLLVAYVAIRRIDERNEARTEWLVALREVCRREQSYLDGDYSAFGDGECYADPQHPFAADIDVFGQQSLFQRVNRTVTTGGSDCLAAMLAAEPCGSHAAEPAVAPVSFAGISPVERIRQQADAISALCRRAEWRTEFCAMGVAGRLDTSAVARAVHVVRDVRVPAWVLSPVAAGVALFMGVGLLATIALAATTPVPSNVAVVWALVQLGVVLAVSHGKLLEISRAVGKLQRQMAAYARLVRMVGEDNMSAGGDEAAELPALLCRLQAATAGSVESFREMERILAGLDRRGNVLGLVLADIFTLADFRLLRRFAMWQRRYTVRMDSWIAAVNTVDALVSMATFCYNEPRGVRAQVVDGGGVVFEARGMCHPFIGAKAVSNDFSIADGNYYVITGANMAGKSTFLRSLGINWLLAMNGMPVFADSLRLSVFPLFTSMRTTDDLTRGISYFNAELLRLKSLIGFCADHADTLIILDEILKGTNSADKLGGSRLFLEYISQRRVTGVIATHDLELSRLAEEHPSRFHNFCFEIELGSNVTYSYRIAPGVARNQNATFLLRELLTNANG